VTPATPPASIGTASMRADGTIVLNLIAETDAITGEARIEITPRDPRYKDTIEHLGGLQQGQAKPIPPWPE